MIMQSFLIEVKDNCKSIKIDNTNLGDLKEDEILISLKSCHINFDHINLSKDGIYSPCNYVCGVVEKVGHSVERFKVKNLVIGYIYNNEICGLSKYCIIKEYFTLHIFQGIDPEQLIAMINDFMVSITIIHRIPSFPHPTSFLILGNDTGLLEILVNLLSNMKYKTMIYMGGISKELSRSCVIIDGSIGRLTSKILYETYGTGVGCIIDLYNNEDSNTIIEESISILQVGGTLISTFKSMKQELTSILYKKSANLININIFELMKCQNYITKYNKFYSTFINEICNNNLRPLQYQTIQFENILEMNIKTLVELSQSTKLVVKF